MFDHISGVVKGLNWLPATQLVQYHRAQMVSKTISSELPETLCAIITSADYKHEHQTRHNNRLRLPAIRTETGRRQIAYSGVKLFNSVSQNRRELESFKTALCRCLETKPG